LASAFRYVNLRSFVNNRFLKFSILLSITMRRTLLPAFGAIFCCVILLSCSIRADIPIVADEPVERFVRAEAARIIQVSEDHGALAEYRIFLSDFPRRDILGLSVDRRRIYISYTLAKLAMQNSRHHWLLRQTLAHEIAHETARHASRNGGVVFNGLASGRGPTQADVGLPSMITLRNYSYESELEADLKGLNYWRKLNWSCHIWIRIMESFLEQNYPGDVLHPTDARLQQAKRECRPASAGGTATTSPLAPVDDLADSTVNR